MFIEITLKLLIHQFKEVLHVKASGETGTE